MVQEVASYYKVALDLSLLHLLLFFFFFDYYYYLFDLITKLQATSRYFLHSLFFIYNCLKASFNKVIKLKQKLLPASQDFY